MSTLLDFLTDIATDTRKQRTFALTPNAIIDATELSETDKIALKSRDTTHISQYLSSKLSPPVALIVFEPNPDPLPDPDPIPFPPPPPPEEPPPTIK